VRAQRTLSFGTGTDSGIGVGECGKDGVTLGEQRDTRPRAEGATKYLPVLGEHGPILGAEQLR
jgi:hypothetical protein